MIQRIQSYPMLGKFKSLDDVEKYLESLRRCLTEDQYLRNYDIDVDTTGANHWAFKTITGIINNVVADQMADTLTLASGNATLGIVGTTATDTITWTWAHLGIEGLADPGADRIFFWDDGESASKWLVPNAAIEISGTNLNVKYDNSTIKLDGSNQLYADITGGLVHNLLSATHSDSLAASPVLGDLIYGNGTPAWQRLAGNMTATKKFLVQTGTGVVSAAPAFDVIAAADLPSHQLDGAVHSVSGLTAGHFLKATAATTFAFAAHGLTYSDVGAAASGHNHDSDYISIIGSPAANYFPYQTAGGELVDSGYDASDFAAAGHNHSGVYEPVLGNPASDGYVLSSTALGVRSWIAPGVSNHDLLSATHSDTAAASPVAGDILYANATPAWTKLAKGTTAQYLKGGDAPSWATLNQAAVDGLTTSDTPTFSTVGATAGAQAIYLGSVSGVWRCDTDGVSIRFLNAADGYAPLQFGIIKGEDTSGTNYLKTTLDIQSGLQCDSFRIDQTPAAGTITPDKTITISCNGVNYKIAVKAA